MNNKYPQISFVFDRRKIATPSIKSSVEIRICYSYKQRFISTGIKLYSTQWKNGKIVNCPDILQISQTLDKQLSDIRQIILDMIKEGNIDISLIPERLLRLSADNINFIDFCKQRTEIRKYGKASDSQGRYNRFMKFFIQWGCIKSFDDIKDSNIIAFDKYLISKGMKPYSKWNNYHRFLNSFILDAIDEGYITRNPYKWINIEKEKNIKSIGKHLTPLEFKRLKNTPMPTESLTRVKDVFIFQTYTCLSYTDLSKFNSDLVQEINGIKVYTGKRQKTHQEFTIPLLTPALEILHKYNNNLPIISNVKYNEYLKIVAQAASIDKPLSSHWARHTGATLLLNEGVDMRIVSKICGHSSIRITEQIYAKLLDETVIDAVSNITI